MMDDLSFKEKCYTLLRQVPRGKVTTYQEIALALNTKAFRAVGSAMAKNKNLIVLPCHRVVRSDGSVGQYALGSEKKIALLREEGVEILNNKVSNMNQFMHKLTAPF